MHRGKVDPGGSELPRGNELSRDHVNRPLVSSLDFNISKYNCKQGSSACLFRTRFRKKRLPDFDLIPNGPDAQLKVEISRRLNC